MQKYSQSFKENVLTYCLTHNQVETAKHFKIYRTTIWKWLNPELWHQNVKRYKQKYRRELAKKSAIWRKKHKEYIRLYRLKNFGSSGKCLSQRWRLTKRYHKWTTTIYKQYNYTCQECGARGKMNAHHIKSAKDYPELKYDISNGICLCIECHKKKHQV